MFEFDFISFDDEVFFDFDLSDFFDCEKSKNLCGKETYGCPVENSEVVSVNGLVVCGDNLLSFQFAEGSPTVKVLSSEFKSGDFTRIFYNHESNRICLHISFYPLL